MPHPIGTKSRPALATLLALTLASLLLAACGSSSSSTATTNASATTPSTGGKATGPARSGRFTAIRECLQKSGITLPKRTPGQTPGGVGGGPTLPKGMTRAQYQAAIRKCGGFAGHVPSAGSRLTSPAFKQALAKFASCMREHGENVPAPNTSGKGPIFSTKGLNTTSAQFKSAQLKCSADLRASFQGTPGGGGPGAAPGGTPTSPG